MSAARSLISCENATESLAPLVIIASAVYLTHEAARLCRVQPSTIRRAVRCGEIRGRGRPFRILGSELFKLCGGPTP
jgi:hypothetical protein